jgi:uncharacterized Tic20 family protein
MTQQPQPHSSNEPTDSASANLDRLTQSVEQRRQDMGLDRLPDDFSTSQVPPEEAVVDLESLVNNYKAKRAQDPTRGYTNSKEAIGAKAKPAEAGSAQAIIAQAKRRAYDDDDDDDLDDDDRAEAPEWRGSWDQVWRNGKFNKDALKDNLRALARDFGDEMKDNFGTRDKAKTSYKDKRKSKRRGLSLYPYGYQSVAVNASPNERLWAGLAHLALVLSFASAIPIAWVFSPFLFFAPLVIGLVFRKQSSFVRQHAFGAFAAIVGGTVGWALLVVAGVLLGTGITIALALTIVGIVLIPFLWLAIGIGILASTIIPIGTLIMGIMGGMAAMSGRTFLYPFVGHFTSHNRDDYQVIV